MPICDYVSARDVNGEKRTEVNLARQLSEIWFYFVSLYPSSCKFLSQKAVFLSVTRHTNLTPGSGLRLSFASCESAVNDGQIRNPVPDHAYNWP